ncbi:hypothetical protein GWI33_017044 [Rhynchophorus ferrugineus]|uniref:Uncharacterized protein n=1 Tax=Rhynchophorus ferrugineus TaxID=354439 RepID=A0A834M9P2_RHYFE|nr:hypothetical protein GWI33_017044 [Rhynchophorus ferrugineus]
MNIFRRLSQSILKIKHCRNIYFVSNRFYYNNRLPALSIKRFVLSTLVISHNVVHDLKINLDNDLQKACEEGEAAILELMTQLEDLIKTTSKEYRSCLQKQIDLIKKATSTGSDIWEDLPQYRVLASKLNAELNDYLVLIKTIGEMAYNQTLISSFLNESSITVIIKKYEDLENMLVKEFEASKELELELLKANVANITSASV